MRDLELTASVTSTKKEKNILNPSQLWKKINAIQNEIKTLVINKQFVKKQTEINKSLYSHC